jgi:hypothetical protein
VRWPFRRTRASASPQQDAPSQAPAWASLPPIERAAAPIEPTARVAAFLHSLIARRPPEIALASLTHDVLQTAPAGIVTGVARPVVGGASERHQLNFVRRLQRRVLGPTEVPQRGAAPDVIVAPGRPASTPEVVAVEVADADPVAPWTAAVDTGAQTATAVATAASPPEQPEGGHPAGTLDQPPRRMQRATAARSAPTTPARPIRAPDAPPAPQVGQAPAAQPVEPPPQARTVAPVTEAADAQPDLDRLQPPERRPVGASRESARLPTPEGVQSARSPRRERLLGLGSPFVRRPAVAPAAPPVAAPPPPPHADKHDPEDAGLRPAHMPPPRETRPRELEPQPAQRASAAAPPQTPPVPLTAPLGRAPTERHVPQGRPRPHPMPTPTDPPTQRRRSTQTPRATRPSAPLVSRRAIARVQRAAEEVPHAVRVEVERRLGADLSGARVHRGSESGEAARELRARAFTLDSEIHVPSHHGPLYSGPGRSLVAHELVHVAQQRRLGGTLPSEDSPAGRALEAEALSIESGAKGMPAPPAQQATSGGGSGPPLHTPAPSGSSPTPPGHAGRAGPQRVADGTPGPSLASSTTEESVEELAGRLYGHIRTRLRSELLVDRERAGLLTDVR